MRAWIALWWMGCCAITLTAQHYPEFDITPSDVRTQIEFLASDDLMGRRTGSVGNDMAAAYIAAHLRAYGYTSPEGAVDFRQPIPFEAVRPPVQSSMVVNKKVLQPMTDFIILAGEAANIRAQGVFAGHGWVDAETNHNDYEGLDVKGKVVFVLPGPPGAKDPNKIVGAMKRKRQLAAEQGAVALIELYQLPFPWAMFANYFGGESLRVAKEDASNDDTSLVYAWLNKTEALPFADIQSAGKMKVSIQSAGFQRTAVQSQNVIGVLEGSDPDLKDEYLLVTAHFDHVGTGQQGGSFTPADSIFNGARDNAIGVAALLQTARALAAQRPARSIIILAVTGEELGLLGSEYYAEHPLIPLEKVVFNFNTDGAGYNDTTAVSIMGWGRTGTNESLEAGVAPFGLRIIADPAPEQGLFDRSDNVSFAVRGVPALSFSPGFAEFDNDILQHYHQVSDEAHSLDYHYLARYCKAFAHACRQIANHPQKPVWVSGDKYEAAGKKLYSLD
ncbi:MAG: M28 family peptidase [Saprospiraceae bacterium]